MRVVCDLVLLSWNHWEETRRCLESLFACTDAPCRLFLVDNGSEPPVREALRAVRPQGVVQEVILLQNQTNEGFPTGMNRGLRASTAPYACLLNNDLIFTPGWLSRMLEVAEAHPEIGVLNPASSTFNNYPPRGMSLEAYAASLEPVRGRYVEVGMCIGFCFLIPRRALERIGLLTEEVERIFFEDEDYCMRAAQAGLRCVVVDSAYVYHAEHKTVRKMPEREALFRRNQAWCERKWGSRLRLAVPHPALLHAGSDSLRRFLEEAVALARRRCLVYVYTPRQGAGDARELFRSVGLVPHVDVLWHAVPAGWCGPVALLAVLLRRKKPFDAILAPTPIWARLFRGLRLLHQADVLLSLEASAVERARPTPSPLP